MAETREVLPYPILGGEGGGGDQGASFGPNYSSETKPASSLGPTGECFSRGELQT